MTTQITIPRTDLQAALLFAAKQDVRFYLNGVLVDASDPLVPRLVATDGARLLRIDLPGETVSGSRREQWILPRAFVEQLIKTIKVERYTLELGVERKEGDAPAVGTVRDATSGLGTRCIDAHFPDWRGVAPVELGDTDPHPGRFNTKFLADAVKAQNLITGSKIVALPLVARRAEQIDTKKDGEVIETFHRHEVLAEAQRRVQNCAGHYQEDRFGIVVMPLRN